MLEFYTQPHGTTVSPHEITPSLIFTNDERDDLARLLRIQINPYSDYASFSGEIVCNAIPRLPPRLLEAGMRARERHVQSEPVLLFRNCPLGHVPWLDFERPLQSKYEQKRDFVSEAWLEVMAQLLGSPVVTYSSANNGDHFHDIHPARELEYTITQKTVNTLHFHSDLPNNRVRPDWVHLLSLRNSPANAVYTPIVRNIDILNSLSDETRDCLEENIFWAPAPVQTRLVSSYGDESEGYTSLHPVVFERDGHTVILYHEGCTTSPSAEGRKALAELNEALRHCKCDLFLREGDFVSIANNHCVHARHVVDIVDMEAHRHRWIQKTWNVSDPDQYEDIFMAGRLRTSDE